MCKLLFYYILTQAILYSSILKKVQKSKKTDFYDLRSLELKQDS